MNRLFIIIAAIAGITGIAWALRQPAADPARSAGASAEREVPSCCQKLPSRSSLLRAKPAGEEAR